MIRVGIVGGSGYTAGELIRLLLGHPEAEIAFVYSHSHMGTPLHELHPDLLGRTSLSTTQNVQEAEVVFLCLGHGHSGEFLQEHALTGAKVIDLSNEFRLAKDASFKKDHFVYGLPEYQASKIAAAHYVANPGCFATALQLALLPLAKAGELTESVHLNATTGSTGAGKSPSETTHFSWRDNNFSTYKAFTHQHLGEVSETLQKAQANSGIGDLLFLPHRGNFSRGIHATVYTRTSLVLEDAMDLYKAYYHSAPFTHIAQRPINLKSVVNTNNCQLHLHKHGDYLLITSVIDNLLKGASGQAVQNMNLMFGMAETSGLDLKASAF